MKKIIICQGLPASGKTIWSKEEVLKSNGATKRLNKDDLREMLDAGKWSKGNEQIVLLTRNLLIEEYIKLNYDVIVDDTNLAPKHIEEITEIAKRLGAEIEVKSFLDVPLAECIKRDSLRTVSSHVGKKVIQDMYDRYLKPPAPEAPAFINGKPKAIICDIDGTLAKCGDRNIYDGSLAHLDTVIKPVREILERFEETHHIIVCSGRDAEHREVTRQWLIKNNIPFDLLLMRVEGDKRKDSIIKQEIYDQFIKGQYNIKFVLDDRNQVVDMWRSNGLMCLQVAEGNF